MYDEVIKAFGLPMPAIPPKNFGDGHINRTFVLPDETGASTYILQQINKNVFSKPDLLMENISRVTDFLREHIVRVGGDPMRETLNFLKTADNSYICKDKNGEYWRMCYFIPDTYCISRGTKEQFKKSGEAFGRFQSYLDTFPTGTLVETIPDFHNTVKRYRALHEAIDSDRVGRVVDSVEIIQKVLSYEDFAPTLLKMAEDNLLPTRVTHNDTKLNNVMFDRHTDKAICVIDLDTVMPGLSANDFGDAIRFGASTADEDEQDITKVHLDLDYYRAYADGFLAQCGDILTENEIKALPIGAKMMTLESAVRFLTDYLNGDIYFKTDYSAHNLVRTKTQVKLMEEIDEYWDDMRCVK